MRYRCLTYQEFELMEPDFNDYLYHQGFSKFEWNLLLDYDSLEAQNILKKYSDQAFEKVMRDVDYLQYRSKRKLTTIHFRDAYFTTIQVSILNTSEVDLTDESSLNQLMQCKAYALGFYKQTQEYNKKREIQIFNLIESGYHVVSQASFKKLLELKQSYQN